MRVLAVDPAVRNTGFAVLEGDGPSAIRTLDFGTISLGRKPLQSECLAAISKQLEEKIADWQPREVAVEGIIYVQSHRTAISMGAARATALIVAGKNKLPVYEYAPRRVKQAIVGKGSADKTQVAFMVRALLGLDETPDPDAADALAVGIAHLSSGDPLKAHLLDRRQI